MGKTIQIERRQRGFFGYVFLLVFVLSQFFMLFACSSGMMNVAEQGQHLSGSMKNAHDAGAGLGLMMLLFTWAAVTFVFGALAYATRGKKIIETIRED